MEINVNQYIEFLLSENEKHNLISRQSGREEVLGHIEDSLALLKFASLSGRRVVDIGSGAGFPALVLAMKCPDAEFVLLESDLKKSGFLQSCRERLELSNVQVLRLRAEEAGRDESLREQFDFCTSRAVAAVNIMLEYGLPLLKTKGRLLLWKGSNAAAEIAAAQNALRILHGRVEAMHAYDLGGQRQRVIVAVKKEQATPPSYPRRTGLPGKKPL